MIRNFCAAIAMILMTFGGVGEASAAGAQAATTTYELVLRDGSRVYGTIDKETQDEVVLRTSSGVVVTAQQTQIVTLRPVTGRIVGGEFQRSDPNTTRLFFAPTGRALKKGEAYLGVYEVFMPSLQVGVTNRFSIGGGTPLLFIGDEWERPYWVTPKVQLFDSGRVQVAAGAFHAFDTENEGGGIAYGVATVGSHTGSVTGGAGVAYAIDGGRSFVAMIGGDRQIARNIKVITENYVWQNGNGVLSFGFRFFGEQLSADLGLAVPVGHDGLIALPVLNFVYSF
jgi:hypothetical protein